MERLSQRLLFQRLRNRVIEVLDLCCSLENLAEFGAFEVLNMVDDFLPIDYENASDVFSEREKNAIAEFLKLANAAADATEADTWDIEWFNRSTEWSRLSGFAKYALAVFAERGTLSENREN